MATTNSNTTTTRRSTAKRPAAKRSAKRAATTRRSNNGTTRPAVKQQNKTAAARRARTTAAKRTESATQAQTNAVRATAQEYATYAERVLLTGVGGALETRDAVVEYFESLVAKYGSTDAAQRQLTRDLKRYERRGTTARNRFER